MKLGGTGCWKGEVKSDRSGEVVKSWGEVNGSMGVDLNKTYYVYV